MSQRIAILICTHDRPQSLQRLLDGLRAEWQPGVFLAIADNGTRSSQAVVDQFQNCFPMSYRRIPEPGLVVARNAAIELALGQDADFLVFIDDDEAPRKGWLASLLQTLEDRKADIATGQVEAEFLVDPPAWALSGRYFEDDGHSYRTSNLVIRASTFPKDPGKWFQSQFNFLGGEDSELLGRLVEGGAVHAVAEGAVVTELVPAERLRRRYIWRRGTRDGAVIAEIIFMRRGPSMAAFMLCLVEAAKKLGYACNHVFWTWLQPWRINNALYDIHATAGICMRMGGFRPAFYGRRSKANSDMSG